MFMTDYDFRILQYNEFECLTRDLLQEEFGIYIESFKEGRDSGIDLRYGQSKERGTIIQVKRFKEWNELKCRLKEEFVKVEKLKPQRYILVTSVGLSPENKSAIIQLFSPYIQTPNDILGRDDLNNLLGKHKNIELKYYKLWLASTVVLQDIINKDVVNWSSFECEQIKSHISSYVNNDSLQHASEILKEHRYVIISGIPGIGKTTLARMLAYHFLANGYEQLVYLASGLNDGAKLFQRGKKQVFFFDDFLGSNVFENTEKDFDKKLVSFIEAIQRERDKVFILTTREYILSAAKSQYEKFQINNIEIAKCTVDLSSYTRYIRANILYNHLAEANLPSEHVEKVLENKKYTRIIEHPNFNPRIIETYIDRGLWKRYPVCKFMQYFEEFFDKPTLVWQQAFENLELRARYALLIFASMGSEVLLDDWYTAFTYFCMATRSQIGLVCEELEWKKIIRILQDCFIRINNYDGHLVVSYFNPSVFDFIVTFLSENKGTQKLLLQRSYYVEQIYTLFRDSPSSYFGCDRHLYVEEDFFPIIVERFNEMMKGCPMSCELVRWHALKPYSRRGYIEINVYSRFLDSFPKLLEGNKGLLERTIDPNQFICQTAFFSKRASLLPKLDWTKINADLSNIVDNMSEEPLDVRSYCDLLVMLDKLGMFERKRESWLIKRIEDEICSEIEGNISDENAADEFESLLEDILSHIPIEDFNTDFLGYLDEKRGEIIGPEEDYDEVFERDFVKPAPNDDALIEEMMTSLRVRE